MSQRLPFLKHNNACGLASRESLVEAYRDALAADPVSAFGGILIANKSIDVATAKEIQSLILRSSYRSFIRRRSPSNTQRKEESNLTSPKTLESTREPGKNCS